MEDAKRRLRPGLRVEYVTVMENLKGSTSTSMFKKALTCWQDRPVSQLQHRKFFLFLSGKIDKNLLEKVVKMIEESDLNHLLRCGFSQKDLEVIAAECHFLQKDYMNQKLVVPQEFTR